MMIGVFGMKWVRMGAVVKACLRALKERRQSSEKFQGASFWVSRVRGTTMSE